MQIIPASGSSGGGTAATTTFAPTGSIAATNVQAAIVELNDEKQSGFPGLSEATPVTVSIDYTTMVLTVTPVGATFDFYVDGSGVTVKYTKTGPQAFPAMTNTSGIWYFYYDNTGTAVTTQIAWDDFSVIAPIYRDLWNATLAAGAARSVGEQIEWHPNTISAADHAWKHTYGAVWESGLAIAATPLATGTPNASGINTCVGMTTGTCLDDNLPYKVTNSAVVALFNQDMGVTTPASITNTNGALFPVRYQTSATLQFVLPATRFPFDWDTGSNRPNFITSTGTRTNVTDTNFFVYFLYATGDQRNGQAVKLISAPAQYTNITNARAVNWVDIQATYVPLADKEIRPLYRMIFEYRNGYNAAIKYTALRETQDIRAAVITQTNATGSLPASSVTVVPAGTFTTTNAQSTLEYLDAKPSGLAATAIKTSAYNIVAGDLVRVDSTGGAFTISAPASPADGATFGVLDVSGACGTNAVLIGANTKTIEGDATGISFNVAGGYCEFVYQSTGTNWKIQQIPLNLANSTTPEITGNTTGALSAAQVSNTYITNQGQGASNVALTLPAAAAGYGFMAQVGTAQAGNTWKFTAAAGDKIYLDNVAGTDGQSVIVTPAVGNFITFASFKTGASTYDWIARTGGGTWTAGA